VANGPMSWRLRQQPRSAWMRWVARSPATRRPATGSEHSHPRVRATLRATGAKGSK
jgi:hypothetical protein